MRKNTPATESTLKQKLMSSSPHVTIITRRNVIYRNIYTHQSLCVGQHLRILEVPGSSISSIFFALLREHCLHLEQMTITGEPSGYTPCHVHHGNLKSFFMNSTSARIITVDCPLLIDLSMGGRNTSTSGAYMGRYLPTISVLTINCPKIVSLELAPVHSTIGTLSTLQQYGSQITKLQVNPATSILLEEVYKFTAVVDLVIKGCEWMSDEIQWHYWPQLGLMCCNNITLSNNLSIEHTKVHVYRPLN